MQVYKKKPSAKLMLMALCCGVFALPATDVYAVSLKENSLIQGDKIRLGDIFYDLPRDEDRVLGAAPKPGQEMTLNARTLLRIALATDLPWRPNGNTDQITIKREATVIDEYAITTELEEALMSEGVGGHFLIEIPEQFKTIALPANQPASFDITKMTISTDRKKFDAVIKLPSALNPIQTMVISGHIYPMIEVPVLKANVQNGTLIGADDIEMKKIRDTDFTPDIISDSERLIGMTARRMVAAGRPIRNVDISAQKIISKGALVILSLNNGPLRLTTEAKALQDGAKGDVIRVLNTGSNQTLQATVVAENQVEVSLN